MKNILKYLALISFSLAILVVFPFHKSNAQSESIKNFDLNIVINKDGTFNVSEKIVYDFGLEQRHGIFRNLVYKVTNEDGKRFKYTVDKISVKDEKGRDYKFEKTTSDAYVELKIGDPNRTITGVNTYIISYRVAGALTYFSDHDELYWNVMGNDWTVPIESSYTTISLPSEIDLDDVKAICYEGLEGSISQDCAAVVTDGGVTISSNGVLQEGENITFGVSFPKGFVTELNPVEDKPSFLTYIMRFLMSLVGIWWFLILPIKILIKSRKEKKFVKENERIVAAWFEPPEYEDKTVFSPAETGFIIDKSINHRELTATIIHLAQKGYLKIRSEGKSNYTFVKTKDFESSDLRNFEKEVLKALFEKGDEIKDKDLRDSTSFFTKITNFNKLVEEELMSRKMFKEKPSVVEMSNMALFGVALTTFNLFLGFVALAFGRKSAQRTLEGVEKYSVATSLFNFLKSQDEQLNFQSLNQMFFEKLLPYAAGFGVEKIWAERFKDITVQKPSWYEGDDFTNISFIGAMTSNIGGSMRSSMTSTRSSSGFSSGFSGGHSGGGGGGGGGGSW